MGLFFDKNKGDGETPEDFVLFNADNANGDKPNFKDEPSDDGFYDEETGEFVKIDIDGMQDTKKLDLNDVSAAMKAGKKNNSLAETVYVDSAGTGNDLAKSDDESENSIGDISESDDEYDYEYEEVNAIVYFIRNHRLLSMCAGIVIIALILSVSAYGAITYTNPLRKYAQAVSSKENIMRTMDVEGTIQSGERYNITSLVAGKIIASEFEVGDVVKKDDILYKIDDTDAKLSVERAQNDLAKASDDSLKTSASLGNTRIVATEAGVLQTLTIKQGSSVNAGSNIGTVLKTDGTVAPLISYVSGTVSVLSVSVGRTLSIGQVIASLKSENDNSSSANSKYDKKSGEIDVQSAQRQLENYTIKSPTSGVVVEKYNKTGDNVGMTNDSNPMMVIVDNSSLTFTFSVDEYRVREMEKGLEVNVTAESIPDQTFAGEVSYVSSEGKADENGKPRYDVCVTISDPGDLKSGMNVKAKVILASAKKAVSVPEKALPMSDGQNALVLVKNDEYSDDEDRFADESLENELAYPEIKVPKGCSLVSVRYGISDGTIVEILSGIQVGDTVVYKPNEDNKFVIASGDNSGSNKSKDSASDNDVNKDMDSDYTVNDSEDEETKSKVRDTINDVLKESKSL